MIEIEHLCRTYASKNGVSIRALSEVSFSVTAGEFVTVRGASGSGKSSLLNILGCLDRPTSGTYKLAGHDVTTYADRQLARIRNRQIGFVFQSFNLLSRTSAVENVEVPQVYRNGRINRKEAMEALDRVGLLERAHHSSSELSGGEQQRVALARALINDPALILADEPTGNLDQAAGAEVMGMLVDLNREGRTIIVITHDEKIAAYAKRALILKNGILIHDGPQPRAKEGSTNEAAS
jgi:putative ABC transport system ATP-binding protein